MVTSSEPRVHWFHITYPISGSSCGGSCLHQVRASTYEKAVEKLFTKLMSEKHVGRYEGLGVYSGWITNQAEAYGYANAHDCFTSEMFKWCDMWASFGDVTITPIHDGTVVRY